MKGEIYNFILHSDVGTGTSVAAKSFYIDWNRIPNSRYKLTFFLHLQHLQLLPLLMLSYILMNWDVVILLHVWLNLVQHH